VVDVTDVAVDLDGVVYPFVEAFRAYCAHRLGVPDLAPATDWDFYREWGIPDDQFVRYLEDACTDFNVFSVLPPEAGTAEGWGSLRDMGVRIHVVTHRPPAGWAQTADWLLRWDLVPDTLTFTGDKTVVTHHAVGPVAAVEDRVEYHDDLVAAGVHTVLLDRPWNAGHDAVRVRSLADFATFVHDLRNG
jgi:hypothetical protein